MVTVAGEPYRVLVHGFSQAQGTFTLNMICDRICSPAIGNDVCQDAEVLELQVPGVCEPTTGTTICAYAPALPAPACNPYGNIADTWYVFNTGFSITHTIDMAPEGSTPLNMALYTGCGVQAYLDCVMGVEGPVVYDDLPMNTDILVRVWNGGGPQAGNFTICVEGDLNTGISGAEPAAPMVMPVPTRDRLIVSGFTPNALLQVHDAQGRLAALQARTDGAGRAELDVQGLAPGLYVLRSVVRGEARHARFIKE
jgi:hypothetical protein